MKSTYLRSHKVTKKMPYATFHGVIFPLSACLPAPVCLAAGEGATGKTGKKTEVRLTTGL